MKTKLSETCSLFQKQPLTIDNFAVSQQFPPVDAVRLLFVLSQFQYRLEKPNLPQSICSRRKLATIGSDRQGCHGIFQFLPYISLLAYYEKHCSMVSIRKDCVRLALYERSVSAPFAFYLSPFNFYYFYLTTALGFRRRAWNELILLSLDHIFAERRVSFTSSDVSMLQVPVAATSARSSISFFT